MNWKKALGKKLKKKGGFTLIEMLIVVAIIAILVAVSIPLVNSSLDKAQKATDAANERAAKAAALMEYMINGTGTGDNVYFYNAETGKAIDQDTVAGTGIQGYNQSGTKNTECVKVTITGATGAVETDWVADDVS